MPAVKLTVLSVAYPFAAVTADSSGGAEQVLHMLDRSLVEAGHDSLVIACEGSRVDGDLFPVPAVQGDINEDVRKSGYARHAQEIERVLRTRRVDLVHMHGVDFFEYLPAAGVPVLVTLHLPPSWYPHAAFRLTRPATSLVCVSEHQRRQCPPCDYLLDPIANGVAVDKLRANVSKRHFALTLGRLCPEKGFELAIDACRAARMPLILGGAVYSYPEHREYFQREIVPRLDSNTRFAGALSFVRKRRFLSAARCLIVPSLCPETSSLVSMEALACGTPVVAHPKGALTEIVDHGRTGFIVEGAAQIADALASVHHLRSEDCRAAAESRFSAAKMSAQYLALYERLAHSRSEATGFAAWSVDEVREPAGLEKLAPGWRELVESNKSATPFQSPAWLLPWWECFGSGTLCAVTVRQDGRLLAVAPLAIRSDALELIGSGVSDYLDVIVRPGHAEALPRLFRAIAAMPWRQCTLEPLSAASPLLEYTAARGEFVSCRRVVDGCPRLSLPESIDEFLASLPAAFRRNLLRDRRRAGSLGELRMETATEQSLDECLDALFRLHASRWSLKDGTGVLADETVQRFHRTAAPALLRRGALQLHAMRIDHRIAGVIYTLTARKRTLFYLSGFDPELASYSVGSLLVLHAIETAIAAGHTTFDFLRGRESYKYRWGAVDSPLYSLTLERKPGRRADDCLLGQAS